MTVRRHLLAGAAEDFLYLSSDKSDSVGGGSGHYNINSLATRYIIPSPPPHVKREGGVYEL